MVLGYIVVNLIFQSSAVIGFNTSPPLPPFISPTFEHVLMSRFLGKAIMGLMLAWALNWMFFDIDSKHQTHALSRHFYYSPLLSAECADDSDRV